jgi:MraZ protein
LFKGKEIYSIDAKGRVSIPVRLRKHFSPEANDSFVLTQGIGPCIFIYPHDHWQQFEKRLQKLNSFIPKEALFKRLFLECAADGALDAQSRITVPQNLLEYAKIEKEVLVLGQLDSIE